MTKLEKLYDHLTPRELALAAFNGMFTGGCGERDQIAAAVPMQTYRGRDWRFHSWTMALGDLTEVYGLWHWRMRCGVLELARALLFATRAPDQQQLAKRIIDAMHDGESALLALDHVLEEVCEWHGIDPAVVRQISGAEPYEPLFTKSPKQADLELYRKLLAEILPTEEAS